MSSYMASSQFPVPIGLETNNEEKRKLEHQCFPARGRWVHVIRGERMVSGLRKKPSSGRERNHVEREEREHDRLLKGGLDAVSPPPTDHTSTSGTQIAVFRSRRRRRRGRSSH